MTTTNKTGLAKYARPALIAGSAIAVVCLALLVIIFFLDSFNATVYSVGGKNIQDATDEARQIRESYTAVRTGGLVFLIASAVTAARRRRRALPEPQRYGRRRHGRRRDVDFEDLAGR